MRYSYPNRQKVTSHTWLYYNDEVYNYIHGEFFDTFMELADNGIAWQGKPEWKSIINQFEVFNLNLYQNAAVITRRSVKLAKAIEKSFGNDLKVFPMFRRERTEGYRDAGAITWSGMTNKYNCGSNVPLGELYSAKEITAETSIDDNYFIWVDMGKEDQERAHKKAIERFNR